MCFPEDDNFYEGQEDEEEYSNHRSVFRTRQKSPRVGDELFVIKVGVITSIAERGGTSLPETVGMALVRRAEGILNKMKRIDLEIERNLDDGTGMILPPPMDPFDGLEVVLGNGFTRGDLRVIPSRRLRRGQNLFEVEHWSAFDDGEGGANADAGNGSVMGFMQYGAWELPDDEEGKGGN